MNNDCGNVRIDALAAAGRMVSVWARLYYLYPELHRWCDHITQARRNGRLFAAISHKQYAPLAESPTEGPRTPEEWDLLAKVALTAACKGRRVKMRRNDYGHVNEWVDDIAREAFVNYNSLGEREVGIVLTDHSWAPAQDVAPA